MVRPLKIDPKQFGTKVGRHMLDYGRDPSKESDRNWLLGYILDIYTNPTEIRDGTFAGQGEVQASGAHGRGPVWFYAKGSDVVITDKSDNFVTILKDATGSNPSFLSAVVLATRP